MKYKGKSTDWRDTAQGGIQGSPPATTPPYGHPSLEGGELNCRDGVSTVSTMAMVLLLAIFLNLGQVFAQSPNYNIGDVITNPDGSKGVVFWLSPDGSGGWMCALNDVSGTFAWSTQSVAVSGFPALTVPSTGTWEAYSTVTADTSGYSHTQLLRAAGNTSTYPAAYAVDFAHGWYLPAIGQLLKLYGQQATISAVLSANGGSEISRTNRYWSSTYATNTNGYYLNSPSGYWGTISKSTAYYVRPVRSFSTQTMVYDTTLTYQWSNGATTPYVNVSPNVSSSYTVTATSGFGCSNTAEVSVVVANGNSQTLYDTICAGSGGYALNGFNLTAAQTATASDTMCTATLSEGTCSTTVTLHLHRKAPATATLSASICQGECYYLNGMELCNAGTYTQHLTAANGCDSTLTLHLSVITPDTTRISDVVCQGRPYNAHGFNIPADSTMIPHTIVETRHATSLQTGCDSITILTLTVIPVDTIRFNETICQGETYYSYGFNIPADSTMIPNVIVETRRATSLQTGCDSITILTLTVNPVDTVRFYETICQGEAYIGHGFNIPADFTMIPNVIVETRRATSLQTGCDSITILTLTVIPVDTIRFNETICQGEAYIGHGFNIPADSTMIPHTIVETQNFASLQTGCDSITILTLTVIPVDTIRFNETICQGEAYIGHGFNIPADSTMIPNVIVETRRATSLQTGCDSITILTLTVNSLDTVRFNETVCQGEPYNGHGFNIPADSTMIPHTIVETQNFASLQTECDSSTVLTLTVLPHSYTAVITESCDSYTWNDSTYLTSGDYVQHFSAANGCDSVVTLHLTINNPVHQATAAVACKTYTWTDGNGQTYTVSGDYTYSHIDSNGCTQVDTLHLTINNPVHQATTAVACETYTWTDGDGLTYTTGGDYTYSHNDTNGCTQVDTLHLTINSSNTGVDEQTACDSYTWIDGVTYTQSTNTPTYILTNAAGCDSVVTLHLTINSSNTGVDEQTACDSYTWIDGVIYTQSTNTPTYTLTNAAGCDSVVTLHLTINNPVHQSTTAVACETYTWTSGNGQTYTTGGDYLYTHEDANGCTQVDTLHLTINNPLHQTTTAVACETYTWTDGDGLTYTTGGDYTYSHNDTNGCTQMDTLHLTINSSNTGVDEQTACDSYTWIDGVTYTQSTNTPTYTLTNAAGCDSVVTLHLTINSSNTGVDEQTACDSYTWIDGVIYTQSTTTPTYTLTNAAGCDSVVTLHLIINNPIHQATTVVACENYTWTDGNGQTYTAGGDYLYTHEDANGCTQVDTLHLTINNPAHQETTAVACETYTWTDGNGLTYTTGGDYTYSHTDGNGCTQVDTLHLTINNPAHQATTVVACENYTWTDGNGLTYTTGGDYTYTHNDTNGCIQVDTLHLTINNPVHEATTIIAYDSFVWNDSTYTQSGDYTFSHEDGNGCTQVDTLHLTIYYSSHNEFSATACEEFIWNDSTYYASGTYVQQFSDIHGADSVMTLHLTVNYGTHNIETDTACETYTWNGTTYTTSGTYTYNYNNASGCASVDTLHLTVNYADTVRINDTICQSEQYNGHGFIIPEDSTMIPHTIVETRHATSLQTGCDSTTVLTLSVLPNSYTSVMTESCDRYTWNDSIYTTSGDYVQHFPSANGCDSVVTLHLTINNSNTGVDEQTACDSYTWIDGMTYTQSTTTPTYTLTNSAGCDSVVTLHLTINNPVHEAMTIIAYDSFVWNGTTYTQGGDYTYSHEDGNGCTQVDTLHLTIYYSSHNEFSATACEEYTWNDSTYYTSGNYVQQFSDIHGADSVMTLHLTVNYGTHNIETDTACETYTWHGTTYTTSGTYTYNYNNASSCASVDTLHLTVNYADTVRINHTICQGEQYNGHGFIIPEDSTMIPHTIVETRRATSLQTGCDSITILTLTITADTVRIDDTICQGEQYNGHGFIIPEDSTMIPHVIVETRHATSLQTGCDSTTVLTLSVLPNSYTSVMTESCDRYTWNDSIYTTSGDYVQHFPSANGCDSVVTLHLTINSSNTGVDEQTACNSYTWIDGVTYTQSTTTPTYTLTNAAGCDSVVTLHLTINNPVHEAMTIIAYDSFVWNGTTYTQGGDYTYSHEDGNGCAQVDTLHLTIYYSSHNEFSATACEEYTWNDSTYYTSGNYVQQFSDIHGADSVMTLHLTVNYGTHNIETDTACETYTWHGTTYTASGDYQHTFTAANGCDSTVTLHLTVNQGTHNRENQIACERISWHGTEYTASGVYTYNYVNGNGCPSVDTLYLTILQPYSFNFSASACESYTWNGNTYTSSGNFEYHYSAANGCDSTVTLHLTIYNPSHHSEGVTACDSYTWTTGNGQTYTASGTYTHSHTDNHGCTQVDTLHLTIVHPIHQAVSVTDCESYTWATGNNQTYTQSGNYTYSHNDDNGCTQVDTLHLTITHGTHNAESLTVCESFTWHDTEYSESGTYTYNYTNDTDCPSADTLHLVINQSVQTDADLTICDHELPYTYRDMTFPVGTTSPSTFNFNYTTVAGCDSVLVLTLHIIQESVSITSIADDFCAGYETVLEANSEMSNYTWNTGETSQSITVTSPGTYTVTATEGNCSGSAQYVISPCDFSLYMPNSFTASHSDGLNDVFQINEGQQVQIKDDDFSVIIYDRWGIEVFHSRDKAFQWDGKVNGRVLEGNMYVYLITYKDLINRFNTLKGTVITF